MATKQEENQPRLGASLLDRKVIVKGDTTYRIVSKSVTEFHFTVPYDSCQMRNG